MNTKDLSRLLDDNDPYEEMLNASKRRLRKTGRHPKQISKSDYEFLKEQDDSRKTFQLDRKSVV